MVDPKAGRLDIDAPAGASLPQRLRRQVLARAREPSNRGLALTLAISAVVLILGGIWAHARVSKEMKGALARELTTLLETEVVAIRSWYEGRRQLVQRAGRETTLTIQAQRLNNPASAAEARAEIAAHVAPMIERRDLIGYWVVDPQGRILASSLDEGMPHLSPEIAAHISAAFRGEPVVTRPIMADDRPVILLAGPIFDAKGQPIAALVLKERPEKQFSQIVQGGRSGATGTTYAFNDEGVVLSQGRFDDLLRTKGLIEREQNSALNLVLRDPGANLLEDEAPVQPLTDRPLTAMAADAVKQRSGYNVDGYRDFRGVRVVGAWRWLSDFGFGLATETEVTEAFRPLAALQAVFAILLALVITLVLGSIVGAALLSRSRERAARAIDAVKTLGQYTLGERLGEGSMGDVYRATHAMLRRPTAVKVLRGDLGDPNAEARFAREVQLTAQLTHPNTIMVYDYGRTPEGQFYYAMEYVDGIDLQALVDTYGPLPPERAVHILIQISGSLEEAHAIGLIHRDVKPSNVMLCRRGLVEDAVKVLDFGLAKPLDDIDPDITSHNKVVGTPRYMSPEAIRGEPLDARADIYSLAAVGYFLLTGRSVFEGDSALAVFRGHLDREPTPIAEVARQAVPRSIAAILHAALAKDRDRRPHTVRAFIELLENSGVAAEWDADHAALWWATQRQNH